MSNKTQSVNWNRAASDDVWAELDRYRKALETIAGFRTVLPHGRDIPTPEAKVAHRALHPSEGGES